MGSDVTWELDLNYSRVHLASEVEQSFSEELNRRCAALQIAQGWCNRAICFSCLWGNTR